MGTLGRAMTVLPPEELEPKGISRPLGGAGAAGQRRGQHVTQALLVLWAPVLCVLSHSVAGKPLTQTLPKAANPEGPEHVPAGG